MEPSRRRHVDHVFEEALDVPPGRRVAFLDARCTGEPEIRAAVEELLRLVDDRVPALDAGCDVALLLDGVDEDRPPARTGPGDVIGAWRLVRLLGHGGMGSVFLVERCDGQFQQTAALKLTRTGPQNEIITQRVERERQIVASLNHPGIARLLDGGRTDDGRPYFVMEYVEGRPIDRECDERRLPIPGRLDLFERVCLAVQHAHGRLVVHRDVKPSNIIVTPDGDVKLLDFGIAGMHEPSPADPSESADVLTRLLTPDYASPEQLRGDPPSTSSDVYQLGLLLYELLTGARAQRVAVATPTAMAGVVCDAESAPPSVRIATADAATCRARGATRARLVRQLRGDLDAIVGRALQKEPNRRYASVPELVDDIGRHRQGLPVRARAGGLAHRTARFALRHRVAVTSGAAVLTTLVVAAPLVMSHRLQASREQQRARQVEDVLGHLFRLPGAAGFARAPSAGSLADHAARLVRRELAGQPVSQARLLTMLGEVYAALGQYDTASEVLAEALSHREQLFGADSEEAAHTLLRLGQSHHYAGRYAEAEAALRSARAIRGSRRGPDHLDTLAVSLELGDLLHSRGDLVAAAAVLQDAIDRLGTAGAPLVVQARALRDHGNVLRDRGALAASEDRFREALVALERAQDDTALQAAITEVYFARLLVRRGAFGEADERLSRSLHALRLLYEGDHPTTAFALQNIGLLRAAQGRYEEAAERYDEAFRVAVAWLGTAHPLVARIDADRADLAQRRGRPRQSQVIGERALALFRQLGLGQHPAAVDVRAIVAEALLAAGRSAEAAVHLRESLAVAERQYSAGDPRTGRIRQLLTGLTP